MTGFITFSLAVALVLGGLGCSTSVPSQSVETKSGLPEGSFSGVLVMLDGQGVVTVNGSSGATADVSVLQGELGWSGFAALADNGFFVYEHLSEEGATIRSLDLQTGSETLLAECDAVFDFDGRTILAALDDDLLLVDTAGGPPQTLGLNGSVDARLSRNGTELAYVASDPDLAASNSIEGDNVLVVRGIDDSGPGTEVARSRPLRPLLLTEHLLVYTADEYGGADIADLMLYDRRSSETTVLASGVHVLDTDSVQGRVAYGSEQGGSDGDGILTLLDLSDPNSVTSTTFRSPEPDILTAACFAEGGGGLWAAFAYPDNSSTIEFYDFATGAGRTVTELRDQFVDGLLPHPNEMAAFLVLQENSADVATSSRSLRFLDGNTGALTTVLAAPTRGLLTMIGVHD